MLGGEVVQLGADPAMQLVAFVLQVIDGGQIRLEAIGVQLVQAAHALAGVLSRPEQDPGLLSHRVEGLGDAMQKDHVANVVDSIGHIVEPFGQLKDVVADQAGNEGRAQPGQDGPGDAVTLMLQLGQLLGLGLGVGQINEQVHQDGGGIGDVVSAGLEQPEVGVFMAGEQPQLHGPTPESELAAAGARLAWVLQAWAASWMASQGLPKGGV
jgi:hypothetical protein